MFKMKIIVRNSEGISIKFDIMDRDLHYGNMCPANLFLLLIGRICIKSTLSNFIVFIKNCSLYQIN